MEFEQILDGLLAPTIEKICTRCKVTKLTDEFGWANKKKGYRRKSDKIVEPGAYYGV